MRRPVIPTLLLASALAACGGTSPTQAPAATSGGGGGGGTATNQPQATQTVTQTETSSGGGGGGSLDTSHGKAHIDLTGVVTKSIDLGFQPILSHFGGMDQTVLYFVPAGADGALALTQTGGQFVAVYTSTQVTVSGIECTASNLKIEATSASGSFECAKNTVILASGASAENAGFKGTFEAHG
jgi:hypothetical protein